MKNRKNNRSYGFTLVEILVVIGLISLLAGLIVPNVIDRLAESRVEKAKSDIRALENALNLYKLDNFNYPSTAQGLGALVSKPGGAPDAKNWRSGGYLKRLVKDPWGNDYGYLSPGSQSDIDVFSYGRDNTPGGDGEDQDVGNWNLDG